MEPKVIISLLNWTKYQDTINCVRQLQCIEYENFEIIVTDNNSPNDSCQKIKTAFPLIEVYETTDNKGYASGHKIAADIAVQKQADILWIVNNDIKVRKNTLSELIKAYKKFGDHLYGSITLKSENPDVINFGGGIIDNITEPFDYNRFNGVLLIDYQNEYSTRTVQSVEGSSFIIPVKVIENHGFMQEDFFMYGEETDYCYRLNKLGIKSYVVTSSIIVHEGGKSFEQEGKSISFIEAYYRRRNMIHILNKHYNRSIVKYISVKTGWWPMIKFFIKYYFANSSFKKKHLTLYYLNLANIHAFLHKRGKTVTPEKFVK